MQQTFYRIWLPISIVVHIALLFLLGLVKLPPLQAFEDPNTDDYTLGREINDIITEPVTLPTPVEDAAPSPITVRRGVPNPQTRDGHDPADGVVLKPGPGGKSTTPGNGVGRTPAPRILTSHTGDKWTVNQHTSDYGSGTGGTDLGNEDGPSRGRAALGSPYGGPLKKELSDLNVRRFVVKATVTITDTGAIERVRILNSYGADDVNDAAIAKLEAGARYYLNAHPEKFTGAGEIDVRVIFEGGRYLIDGLQ
jgi:hypothetical protein